VSFVLDFAHSLFKMIISNLDTFERTTLTDIRLLFYINAQNISLYTC